MENSTEAEKASAFAQWVREFGVPELAQALKKAGHSATPTAVYYWLDRTHEPRGKKVRAMVEISGGKISLADVNDHFAAPKVAP